MGHALLLCHTSTSPRRLVCRLRGGQPPARWLFLSPDYIQFMRWERRLAPVAERLDVSSALSTTAERLRRPFLDGLTDLGRHHDSLAWWSSRLAERNPMVSPVFLHCCYLRIARDLLASPEGTLVVIAESRALLQALADHARTTGRRVEWMARSRREWMWIARAAWRVVRFLVRSAFQRRRDSCPRNAMRPFAVLRTWVDEGCFGVDGEFHDRYLPGLHAWLEARDIRSATLPVLYELSRSYGEAWRWFRRSRQPFLNPYRHYRAIDYLHAVTTAWRQLSLPAEPLVVEGMDVGGLVAAEGRRVAFDVGVLEAILSYRLPLRLQQAGIHVDLFVDEFENSISEKALILGFRRYSPATRIVAFQHGLPSPMLLSFYVTAAEAAVAPVPDRVVCVGNFFREVLVREGLPPDAVVSGPALRYHYLGEVAVDGGAPEVERTEVLVTFPLELDASVELLVKTLGAFSAAEDLGVRLKIHPLLSPDVLLRAAGTEALPAHFSWARGDMRQWLARARVVVGLGSSTLYEAMIAGVPVVVVGRHAALDLNPLAWHDDLDRVVRRPEDILAATRAALRMEAAGRLDLRRRARERLREAFDPVTDESMAAFVDGLIPAMDRPVVLPTA